jgi:hypothetical protein
MKEVGKRPYLRGDVVKLLIIVGFFLFGGVLIFANSSFVNSSFNGIFGAKQAGLPNDNHYYGCNEYGGSAAYSFCTQYLAQQDVPFLNLVTTTGINCTPDPIIINSITTCTGTLGPSREPPVSDVLYLSLNGGSEVPCNFVGKIFSCSGISTMSSLGPVSLVARVGLNPLMNTDKNLIVFKYIDVSQTSSIGNFSGADPFVSVACNLGTNLDVTCTGVLKDYYLIQNDFRFGAGNSASNLCVQVGQTVSCNGISASGLSGVQNIWVSFVDSTKRPTNLSISLAESGNGNINNDSRDVPVLTTNPVTEKKLEPNIQTTNPKEETTENSLENGNSSKLIKPKTPQTEDADGKFRLPINLPDVDYLTLVFWDLTLMVILIIFSMFIIRRYLRDKK